MQVLHAIMEEIVQIMNLHSHAHVRLDIVVIAAKSVNTIFKNIYIYFFYFPLFIPGRILWNIEGKLLLNLRRETFATSCETVFSAKLTKSSLYYCYEILK